MQNVIVEATLDSLKGTNEEILISVVKEIYEKPEQAALGLLDTLMAVLLIHSKNKEEFTDSWNKVMSALVNMKANINKVIDKYDVSD